MKYPILGVIVMSFISGLILSYVYFSMNNLRADVAEIAQLKAKMIAAAQVEESKTSRFMASTGERGGKLQPPKFSDKLPTNLRTFANASLKLEWDAVAGAKAYNVFIESKTGKSIRKFQTKNTFLDLKNLPIPESEDAIDYNVRLATLNNADEMGTKSEARPLEVGRTHGVRPPTIKSIEVLD